MSKTLSFKKEQIRVLVASELAHVGGGQHDPAEQHGHDVISGRPNSARPSPLGGDKGFLGGVRI